MKHGQLQLLVHGPNIGLADVRLEHSGVSIDAVHKAESPNYLFIDITIGAQAQPGTFSLEFLLPEGGRINYDYVLKPRHERPEAHKGLHPGDVIYLITPDRFVNADKENDEVAGLKEGLNRSFHGGRHGGDLKGVLGKLDYIKDLGATTVWLNPVLQNDMPEYSYHGYATTDYYQVDARYGSNALYKQLAEDLHQRGMKLMMDQVFNHCGLQHWWMSDLPFSNWIHNYPEYDITNHAIGAISDPHAAAHDLEQMEKGWFVSVMPDLNHSNPFMVNYLIQNSIWWIEYAGLDGIRQDTYPYNLPSMMAEWARRVKEQYPDFYLVGETWVDNEAQEAYWADKADHSKAYDSNLGGISDFPVCFAIHKAFKDSGDVRALYETLSRDFLYLHPETNKIFADNHDMDRFFYTIGGDLAKYKAAMTFLLTTRGIPQIYYGTELLMQGHGEHGIIREDFPGGWAGDRQDGSVAGGRSPEQNEAFDFLKKLLQWRKKSEAIRSGKLTHFVPYDNVYLYARTSASDRFVVVINNNSNETTLDTKRYAEVFEGWQGAESILDGAAVSDLSALTLPPNSAIILQPVPEVKTSIK
jgi:glycosidase